MSSNTIESTTYKYFIFAWNSQEYLNQLIPVIIIVKLPLLSVTSLIYYKQDNWIIDSIINNRDMNNKYKTIALRNCT